MEDYYDSDYVPVELLHRYYALQRELVLKTAQQRQQQQCAASSPGAGTAAAEEGLGLAATMTTPALNLTFASFSAQCRQRPPSKPTHSVQSAAPPPHTKAASPRVASSHQPQRQPHRAGAVGHGETRHTSSPRRGPRTSVALDEAYEVRRGNLSRLSFSESPSSEALPARSHPHLMAAAALPSSALSTSSHRPRTTVRQPQPRRTASPRHDGGAVENEAPRDPYGNAEEARLQERFLSESRRLGKPFVPPGGGGSSSSLEVPTRFMLGDCVKRLYRSLMPDWRVAAPMVVSTAEDLIAVYFSLDKLAKVEVTALLRYMNAALKHNDAVREFRLMKVPEGWDVVTNDGFVLYTFRPPWVKKRVFLPDTVTAPHAHVLPEDAED